MAKQDPFSKDGKTEGASGDDFSDVTKGSKGGGNRMKVIVLILLVGALAAGGVLYYFSQDEDTGPSAEEAMMKPPPRKPRVSAEKGLDLAPKPAPTMDLSPKPAPTMETAAPKTGGAPKIDVPAIPGPSLASKMESKEQPAMPDSRSQMTMPPTNMPPKELPKTVKTETTETAPVPEEEMDKGATATEAPVARSPENGASRNYDESSAAARFTWTGTASWIAFSRNPNMVPHEIKAKTRGNHYDLQRPVPGVWYWQLGNGAGKSQVRSFTISAPVKRALAILDPKNGSTLMKDNGTVAWKGDHYITYYRVEFSNQGWANPNFRFATTGTQLQVRDIPQGPYEMRVGAFSEVSGRWEYTDPIKVTVQ